MNTIYTRSKYFFFLILLVVTTTSQAQLIPGGVYSIGPTPTYTQPGGAAYTGNFSTITLAVAQLNLSPATGNYILELQNNYVSTLEVFPISITYSGNASAKATIRAKRQRRVRDRPRQRL